jgi:hypothetical protein
MDDAPVNRTIFGIKCAILKYNNATFLNLRHVLPGALKCRI